MQHVDNFQEFLEIQEDINHYCAQTRNIKKQNHLNIVFPSKLWSYSIYQNYSKMVVVATRWGRFRVTPRPRQVLLHLPVALGMDVNSFKNRFQPHNFCLFLGSVCSFGGCMHNWATQKECPPPHQKCRFFKVLNHIINVSCKHKKMIVLCILLNICFLTKNNLFNDLFCVKHPFHCIMNLSNKAFSPKGKQRNVRSVRVHIIKCNIV